MDWRGLILGLRGLSFGPERTDIGPERADFGLERADLGLERADLGPERGLGGGDGRTDGRMDVWKFTPVSYSTLALWGRCPKRQFFFLLLQFCSTYHIDVLPQQETSKCNNQQGLLYLRICFLANGIRSYERLKGIEFAKNQIGHYIFNLDEERSFVMKSQKISR